MSVLNELLAGLLLDGSLAYWYWWRPIARPWFARWHVEVKNEALLVSAEMLKSEAEAHRPVRRTMPIVRPTRLMAHMPPMDSGRYISRPHSS